MTESRYGLEQCKPARKYTCPHCGRPKCFTRYKDYLTDEYIADECGYCDHQNSCPVKNYPPRDYFRNHPEARPGYEGLHPVLHDQFHTTDHFSLFGRTVNVITEQPAQSIFFDISWAERAAQRTSTFRTWFESLPFPADRIQQVLADYYVGATKDAVILNHYNYGPAVVFWLIDEQQRPHDAKMMAYKPDGHRLQWGNFMRNVCEKRKVGPQLQSTDKVLFGLHLTARYPDRTVCIVESEKTALVCACMYPEYVWLATGGCGNLKRALLMPILHRTIIIFPDSGKYDKWTEAMKLSGVKKYHVIDLLEGYEDNTDIADIILCEAQIKSILSTQLSAKERKDV